MLLQSHDRTLTVAHSLSDTHFTVAHSLSHTHCRTLTVAYTYIFTIKFYYFIMSLSTLRNAPLGPLLIEGIYPSVDAIYTNLKNLPVTNGYNITKRDS
jgi:hypothetical protein